jgi:Ca2+-binding RTX toxin-like protein
MFRFTGTGDGGDTITDFLRGTDKIEVSKSGFGFTTLVVTSNAGGVETTTAPQFVYDQTSHILYYDSNGVTAGGLTQIATLNASVTALNATDFHVIA